MTITLRKIKQMPCESVKFYSPVTERDKFLMQHCVNEDLDALNEIGLEKVKAVASAHGWSVTIEEGEAP